MATGNGLIAQAASTYCELCDRQNECEWKCVDCEEAMCDECKTTHLRSKATREHTINTLRELMTKPKPPVDENEESELHCPVHSSELILMYCEECNTPVCADCISGEHKKHDIVKINSVLEKKKLEMTDIASTARIKLSKLKENIGKLQTNRDVFHRETNDVIATIEHQGQILKNAVDDIVKSFADELKKEDEENIKHFETVKHKIKQNITEVEELISDCENNIESRKDPDISIIRSVDNKKQLLNEIQSSESEVLHPSKFAVGEINTAYIRSAIGCFRTRSNDDNENSRRSSNVGNELGRRPSNISNVASSRSSNVGNSASRRSSNYPADTCESTITQIEPSTKPADSSHTESQYKKAIFVTSFKSPSGTDCVAVKGNTQAWIGHRCVGDEAVLMHINGKSKQKIKLNFKLGDMAVTSGGDLFVTVGLNGHHIKKLSQKESFDNIADTAPFFTEGIHVTLDNELLICLYNGTTKQGKVIRMTETGEIKQEIQRDSNSRALFQYPQLVSQNMNKDVCVVDYTNSSVAEHTLVAVDKDDNLRFRYTGRADLNKKTRFSIFGVACDKFGCIFLSDNGNYQIHLLDKNGKFLQFILNSIDGIKQPRGLSIDDDGKLWICNKRDIMVFRLNT